MIDWKFEYPKKFEKQDPAPEGVYRIRFEEVGNLGRSESGNPVLPIVFSISGHDQKAYNNLTFNRREPQKTNNILMVMAETFGIPLDEVDVNDFSNWIGRYGVGYVVVNEKYGNRNTVDRFILPKQQVNLNLPAWVEGSPAPKNEYSEDTTELWGESI